MKKIKYIFAAFIAVFVCLLLYALIPKPFKWNFDQADPNGHEPYDMAVFDSLMYRSLPNGYEIMEWKRPADADKSAQPTILTSTEKALNLAEQCDPKTQSLLIIQRFKFADADNNEVSPLIAALNYANAGGDVLLVREQLDGRDPFVRELTKNLGKSFDYGGYNSPNNYLPDNMRDKDDLVDWKIVEKDTIKVHRRYAPTYYQYCNTAKTGSYSDVSDLEDYGKEVPEAAAAEKILKKMQLSLDPYFKSDANIFCYGLNFHNEKSGGNVYLCTLGIYFSNLGVTIPDADKVIAFNMERISHKPVVRVEYKHRKTKSTASSTESEKTNVLYVLSKNEALSFAWLLVLLLAVIILACGIYRRHPAKQDAHLVYVDETDPVAVREAKFRQSPLLHFIFQYSWLYKGQQNYTDLFLINYRQFARYVNKRSGMELGSASENDLIVASKTLALRTGLDAAVVKQDLLWMRDVKLNADAGNSIPPSDYVKSQQIIEKYV